MIYSGKSLPFMLNLVDMLRLQICRSNINNRKRRSSNHRTVARVSKATYNKLKLRTNITTDNLAIQLIHPRVLLKIHSMRLKGIQTSILRALQIMDFKANSSMDIFSNNRNLLKDTLRDLLFMILLKDILRLPHKGQLAVIPTRATISPFHKAFCHLLNQPSTLPPLNKLFSHNLK